MSTSDTTTTQKEEQQDPAQIDYQQGLEFFQNGSYGQAVNSLHNALIGFEQGGNEEGVANAKDKLGDVCLAQEQFEKAEAYYQEAYAICKKFDDLMSLLALRKKLVRCHRGQKNYDAALQIYLEMLDYYEAMNNPGSSVETIVSIAETYREKGDLQNAIDAFNTAADIHAGFKHQRQAEKLRSVARELEAQL